MIRETDDFIKDIIDAIDDIEIFLKGFDFNTFIKNKKTIYAVIRAIEIIGEAVKKIPSTLKDENPFIPWRQIAGMRDKLIHGYFGIDMMILWKTITEDIPKIRESVLQMMKNKNIDKSGFSMVEIAIVMVIIGILTAGGMSMMRTLTERKMRNETIDYLNQCKDAITNYAIINGTLPFAASTQNGTMTANTFTGWLPYFDLRLKPTDSNGRVLKYVINANLSTNRQTTCNNLRAGIAGNPLVVDAEGSTTNFPVAAILISSGPMDADSDGNVFDLITGSPTHNGNNVTGAPNYLRNPPTTTFDDLVVYIGGLELYGKLSCTKYDFCSNSGIDIRNNTGGNLYYKKNNGACTAWTNGTDQNLLPIDNYMIYSDSLCNSTTPCAITYAQHNQTDYNNNCQTNLDSNVCNTSDR
ncbi:MAG: DUF86 domain-containing protein [Desulfobacterales bacterium]|nr:DUF86 domain-containing protein [Desulfobacterales bacterium]